MEKSVEEGKKSSGANNQHRCCSFVISGFGPFAGVPDNPTSTLILCLRDNKAQLLGDGINIRETHILDTSADAVKSEIQAIYSRLRHPNVNNDGDKSDECKDIVVMIHLGVNYRGKQMQLEQCAYNDATFRVPDNNGYQPQNESILIDSSFGSCLRTTLALDEIVSELQQQGHPSCRVSQDPGRFVCNYTYCLSLNQCQSVNDEITANRQQSIQQTLVECHSLFLHVTPFAEISKDDQLRFIVSLLKSIDKNVTEHT